MQRKFKLALVAAAAMACFHGTAGAQSTSEIVAELKRLREELQQVRTELETIKRTAPVVATVAAPASPQARVQTAGVIENPTAPPAATTTQASTGVNFFGYGEMSYRRPTNDPSSASATVNRGVLGWAYRFNERTRFAAELEIENAVVSAGDRGEVALEQFYVEHDLTRDITAKAGLFLMPVGYINEVHEPTHYFGVNRNLVETAVIPSTWRELGSGLRGTTDAGLRWDAGLVTSFDLTKWDATSTDGQESPLAAIHQEGQRAKASNVGAYGALNYNGIPGFNIGDSVFSGGVGQKRAGFAAPDANVLLTELHARWQPGKWDLSALVAKGQFGNVDGLNATFAGQPTPVPNSFGGAYAQAAYRVWEHGDYTLTPFVRYEHLNTAWDYSGLAPGLAPLAAPDTRVWTLGANFYLSPQVVFKVDVQRYLNDSALDRFDLGVGFHF